MFKSPSEPFVERNRFRAAEREAVALPEFEALRPRLPVPVLPEDPAWERLYWAAWEALWSRLRLPVNGSLLAGPFPRPADGDALEMEALATVAQLAGYAPGPFRLITILDSFYARQHDDGFICRALDPITGQDCHQPYEPNSTGPNLLAWAEWRHFRLTGDASRVAAVFPSLVAYHRWCRANRTWPNGLYWATGLSSGLVNQPRVPGGRFHHLHWSWVDATAQASSNAAFLERMAALLGEQEVADEMAAQRGALAQTFNTTMWNAETQFYQDVAPDGRFSAVKSIAAYYALLDAHLIPKDRLTPFVQHLRDSWSFRTPTAIPTLSADSEAYNRTGNGWRGAVRSSLTYMVLRGLGVAEQHTLAHQLAVNHVAVIGRILEESGHFWENYAPEQLGPGDPALRDVSGRTPAAIVAMLLENVLGIVADWPLRQVVWRRQLERAEEYGVRNLPLGDEGTLDLLGAGKTLRIRTDAPFTLILHAGTAVSQTAVPAGAFTIEID